ncbi:MAG: hypothetical protein ACRCZG_01370 [Culicoidibacterales bacterium]
MNHTSKKEVTEFSYVREHLETYGTTIVPIKKIEAALPELQHEFPQLLVRKSFDERANYYIVSI